MLRGKASYHETGGRNFEIKLEWVRRHNGVPSTFLSATCNLIYKRYPNLRCNGLCGLIAARTTLTGSYWPFNCNVSINRSIALCAAENMCKVLHVYMGEHINQHFA